MFGADLLDAVIGHVAQVTGSDCSESGSERAVDGAILVHIHVVIGPGLARMIVSTWLSTDFIGGRHARRVEKISLLEE